jgi:predicted ATPase/DNA-binding CsgD family transcriptional regulator
VTVDWRDLVSAREADVLAAIGAYQTNAQIAERLHISIRTVESHVSSLLRKVGVEDRRALAAAAASTPARNAPPVPLTRFVGRAAERAELVTALQEQRLVSLLGPGGVGKTRLAIEVAAADAVFVDLVPVRSGMVTQAIAHALGVIERPGQPLVDGVLDSLRAEPCLLIIDNCEHVLDDVCPLLERVLVSCPRTTVIATSRERLGLQGERTLVVAPLPLESDAELLFVDRARTADSAFTADAPFVSDLCARLDGIPLAIELTAARVGSLGVDGLRTALRDRLRLLAGGRGHDQRHRSLRAVIGWSHDLLDPAERTLFRHLSIFVGGFDLAAVAAIAPSRPVDELADILGRLVDKSLLSYGFGRWRMLETVREFAAEMLANTGDDLRDRYVAWALGTAVELNNHLEDGWQAGFDVVVDDLRAALAATPPAADPVAHRLACAIARLSYARRHFTESRSHYEAAAVRASDGTTAAEDLCKAADVALIIADGPVAYDLLLAAAAGSENNTRAFAYAYAVVVTTRYPAGPIFQLPQSQIRTLLDRAIASSDGTDARTEAMIATARAWLGGPDAQLAEVALRQARTAGDPVLVLGALDAQCASMANAGQLRMARQIAEERIRVAAQLDPYDPSAGAEIVDAIHVASTTAISTGDLPAAVALARSSPLPDPLGNHRYLSGPRLIRVLALTGQLDEAIAHADELWDSWQRAGSPPTEWMSTAIAAAALAHGLRDDGLFTQWRQRACEVAGVGTSADSPDLAAAAAFVDARVAVHTGQFDNAAELVARAFAPFPELWWQPYAHAAGAELAVAAGLADASTWLAAAEPAANENDWAAACLTRAHARLTGDAVLLEKAARHWERIDAEFEHAYTMQLSSGSDFQPPVPPSAGTVSGRDSR